MESAEAAKLIQALEESPNLASRALVMLLDDDENVQKVREWIKEQSTVDIRFARLGERAGITVSEWKELPRRCPNCGFPD